jgi:RNA polymerase sigma factor (sigma-70 family)
MGSRRSSELFGHLETLFRDGAIGGLSDSQLLERFLAGRDEAGEAAFRALVARHGPMVLRVCRSVLDDAHETEDAFQVTFLALARKAGSIRKHDSIASWLHGTAHRVALKARSAARRRLARALRMAEADVSSQSPPPIADGKLSPILHEEIERLPAKYRAPIVLCYLEGMTQEQAAVELGWPAGTVRGRLARARDLLRSRLTRRGLALSAGLAASTSDATAAGLSAALIESTVRAALGRSTAAKLSRAAALLLKTVLRDMALARLVQLAAPLLLIAVVAGGAAILAYSGGTKLFGERTSLANIESVWPPTSTDPIDDPLPEGALARLGTTRFLHGSHVKHFIYSPDGATLAALDGNGALYLWDPSTGRERRRFETGSGHVTDPVQFTYAPDGRSLAVQAEDVGDEIIKGRGREHFRWTKLFDPMTGHELRRFDGQGTASCLAFSPDGKLLAGSVRNGRTVVITL